MAVKETRITISGGVLGPLGVAEVVRLRQLLETTPIDPNGNDRKLIDKFGAYLEHVVEVETVPGRIA